MTEFHMYELSDCLLISQTKKNSENLLLRRTVSIGRRLGRVLLLFAAISQVSPVCLGSCMGVYRVMVLVGNEESGPVESGLTGLVATVLQQEIAYLTAG